MKFQSVALLGMVALLTVGSPREASSKHIFEQTQSESIVASTVLARAQTGTFRDGEHPTKGKVSIVTRNGKRYLEFDNSFKTDQGPALYVILHKSDAPPISGIQEKDYLSIAPLKKTTGNQSYAIPDNVNLANFKSVAIWCRQFNATFGFAPLVNQTTSSLRS